MRGNDKKDFNPDSRAQLLNYAFEQRRKQRITRWQLQGSPHREQIMRELMATDRHHYRALRTFFREMDSYWRRFQERMEFETRRRFLRRGPAPASRATWKVVN